MGELQRLDKVLANLGYGSRKDVKKMIKNGAVEIEDIVAVDPEIKIDPETQTIKVNGRKIEYRKYIYLMLNKPQGVITATEDRRLHTVLDLIDEEYLKFEPSPVGRLDKDTEGLLLLTNDGMLNHNLTSPRKNIDKEYYAEISGRVGVKDIEDFNRGVLLDDGYKTMPADLKILEESEVSKVIITIKEGKYHQVKRMFEAVGKKVIYLKRLSMGNLKLDENLRPGEYRELTEQEIEGLKSLI
ncbi:pseudouridine synthase [Lutispora thermophila]|uniref:Pseudouridine synthase n=1 Tax=Lutispora thermophila DSM 19022 TaxID=1122184 RepID=A0A1M6CGY7_9FIRM|nr:pseudouridine synthase [Lutispora thermophila]SHI60111.1 ribosomal small subunit pseudouridine synthase A [Lutispora thermophila DSM 19022]